MATAPLKSRPLHNFSLPRLRWAHCNPRVRRRNSPDPHHHQPPTTSPPTTNLEYHDENIDHLSGSKDSLELEDKKPEVLIKENDDLLDDGEGTEAMPWKLRPRKVATFQMGSFNKAQKVLDERGSKNVASPPNFTRSRGAAAEGGGGHRKAVEEKRRLWISLSKEEIEEDIYAFTSSRPARRPKKRSRNVQRQIDEKCVSWFIFGGLIC